MASQQLPFRLIVVSNRGPYKLVPKEHGWKYEKNAGGLTAAMLPVIEEYGGAWVASGHPGGLHANVPGRPPFDMRYIELTPEEEEGYYHGVSNSALWPLCHYFLGRVHFDRAQWQVYEQVNRRFAEVTLEEAREDDLIWVHDYHLARVPLYIREQRLKARIAFFWHIPFPALEMYRVLPWRVPILKSLLTCDVVGFHIPEYVKNFTEAAVELLGAQVEGNVIRYEGYATRVIARPIGIDDVWIEQTARSERTTVRVQELRESVHDQTFVLGVERMDYTKGILERLAGVEHLLELKPEWRGKVTLVQIVTPSREGVEAYRQKKREIDEIVGRVNGQFGTDVWLPIRYLYRFVPPSRLIAYYRAADIALVTPLRDGLNLVAKEYVMSRVDEDGVLILSEFAGVTFQLPEALTVNPYDIENMAGVLEQALKMPKDEQQRRMRAMRGRIREQGIRWWTQGIIDQIVGMGRLE